MTRPSTDRPLLVSMLATLLATLAIARPSHAQSNDATGTQSLAPIQLTGAPVYGARVSPSNEPAPPIRPDFPRLRFGIGWEGTLVGSGSHIAGGAFGARLNLGVQVNRWIAVYARVSGSTFLVSHVAHFAAVAEFQPHPMVTISAGLGYVAYAYTPWCLFGGCSSWSDQGVTAPIRVALFTNRSSNDRARGGFSFGAEFIPGVNFSEYGGSPLFGGALFLGYERM